MNDPLIYTDAGTDPENPDAQCGWCQRPIALSGWVGDGALFEDEP